MAEEDIMSAGLPTPVWRLLEESYVSSKLSCRPSGMAFQFAFQTSIVCVPPLMLSILLRLPLEIVS